MNLETRRSLFNGVFGLCILFLGMSFLELLLNYALNSRIRKQEAYLTILAWPQYQIELIDASTLPPREPALEISGPIFDDHGKIKCGGEMKLTILPPGESVTFNKEQEKWLFEILERRAGCK